MKAIVKAESNRKVEGITGVERRVQAACLEALESVEGARQKCLIAGQLLNELKAQTDRGDFMGRVAELVPQISHDTANIWMRAAANVAKALPAPPDCAVQWVDVEVEVTPAALLTMPDSELPEEAREWKQQWFDFVDGKTIKECLAGVFLYGNPGHSVDRAVNGKTKGGGGGDRKDFPLFVAVKLKDMGAHLAHWETMTATQRTEALDAVRAAILGDEWMARGRERKAPFKFAAWPVEVCQVVLETVRARVGGKGGK